MRALNNIALYYALQKPARAQTPATGDQAAGAAAAAGCAGCHGDKGVSGNPDDSEPRRSGCAIPRGRACGPTRTGSRSDETMKGIASALDDNADQEPVGLLRGSGAAAAERAQAADRRGMGAAMRPLSRRQRQQHRSAPCRRWRAQRVGLSGKGVARLSRRASARARKWLPCPTC